MRKGIAVIGMNLNGQELAGIQQLQQERKTVSVQTGQIFSPEQQDIPQGFTGIFSIGDAAFMTGQGGYLQAFAGDFVR